MLKVGLAIVAIGFGVQLFSGFTWTVASPDDCPDTWDGEDVTVTEVYDAEGRVDGYWCLVPGSFTQANEPTFQNIPVGERSGYSQVYGFGIIVVGGVITGIGAMRNRRRWGAGVDPEDPSGSRDDTTGAGDGLP